MSDPDQKEGMKMARKHECMPGAKASMACAPGTPPMREERSATAQAGDTPISDNLVFEQALQCALAEHKIAAARTLVANAEAASLIHGDAETSRTLSVAPASLVAAKARIALATGDHTAARAILVRGIEMTPTDAALKALMTEVFMANGRATDVRPVLKHLGNDAQEKLMSSTSDHTPVPKRRDTSS